MAEPTEPRALTAALASPAFVTRSSGLAQHAANRHVERWAPEAGADRVGSLRNLGFVDRLIAPWIETAQRSSTLRMFSHFSRGGNSPEREANAVSWVFPRPWYQDELDWMAAARNTPAASREPGAAPTMLTTRGTYVAPQQQQQMAARPSSSSSSSLSTVMPSALYEYVAPSLSIAQPAAVQGTGFGGNRNDAYSPLVSFASAQAAQMIGRIAPSVAASTKSPMLRDVLATILQRATVVEQPATRVSQQAPELVTPPAPRPDAVEQSTAPAQTSATQLAARMVEQRAQIVELQRVTQQVAARELVARQAIDARVTPSAPTPSVPATTSAAPEAAREAARVAVARAEQARERGDAARSDQARAETVRSEQARSDAARSDQARAEATRIEERVAQRVAERQGTQRLHEQARTEAAQHARSATIDQPVPSAIAAASGAQATRTDAAPSAISNALAALPPELATYLSARPRHAVQAITELDTAMRAVELLARGAASPTQAFEATRGPRLILPAGIGGLVATLDHARAMPQQQAPRANLTTQPVAPTQPAIASRRIPTLTWTEAATPAQSARTAAVASRGPSIGDFRGALVGPMGGAPQTMQTSAPTSAFAATTSSSPVALAHVAWADRWLARFAGATPRSLDAFAAATTGGMQALVDAAPTAVFVSPVFDIERPSQQIAARSYATPASTAPAMIAPSFGGASSSAPSTAQSTQVSPQPAGSARAPSVGPTLIPSAPPVVRYDDNAETPDDVFASISATASKRRATPAATPASLAAANATAAAAIAAPPSVSHADAIAHSAPTAPNAGMSAQLSASPFAPALRHLLPLTASASFDVRALFGAGLSTSYLAGLLAPSSHEVQVAAAQSTAPAWSRWSETSAAMTQTGSMETGPMATGAMATAGESTERAVLDFEPAYVTPELPANATPEMIQAAQAQVAQQQAVAQQTAAITQVAAQLVAAQTTSPAEIAAIATRAGIAPGELAAAVARVGSPAAAASAQIAAQQQLAASAPPTTTLRTALLSWDVDPAQPGASSASVAQSQSQSFGAEASRNETSRSTAHSLIDSLSLPMLGDAGGEAGATAWTGPGMVAERARSWSVAQERSSADLSFDFVSPELVLAARVYGLGPAEAAQAARLAVAGPGHIGAMANAVDRTFVQAMAIEADRRRSITTAYPSGPNEISAAIAPLRAAAAGIAPTLFATSPTAATTPASNVAPSLAQPMSSSPAETSARVAQLVAGLPSASSSSFGVERRMPRGAFLWPSSTVGALGLNAAAPDGEQSMSVAALELLAAQAVAELGTYAALADRPSRELDLAGGVAAQADSIGASEVVGQAAQLGQSGQSTPSASAAATTAALLARTMVAPMPNAPAISTEAGVAALYQRGESSEADVLASAAALVPLGRRARFDALYVALSQSPAGRSWSPAARAARAFALAGHGASDDSKSLSAHERAATAWDVLPVVYATSVDTEIARERASLSGSASVSSSSSSSGSGGGGGAGSSGSAQAMGGRGRAAVANRRGANATPGLDHVEGTRVDTRPGLANLSARAGEALGSYVSPTIVTQPSSSSSSSSGSSAASRAPTAAQELVRTGRPSGRHGGGEVEIPSWFEAAARKMLDDRSSASEGISLAELTLIQAAPASHIAAADAKPTASTSAPAAAHNDGTGSAHKVDVEKLAHEVYRHIMHMLDVARARNGEPYL